MKPSRKEIQWVLRAQSVDIDALNSLLKAIQDPVYRYIVSLMHDEHLAYDRGADKTRGSALAGELCRLEPALLAGNELAGSGRHS